MPRIRDVDGHDRAAAIARRRGRGDGTTTVRVTCREVRSSEPDAALVGRLRGSVLLLGALLGRTGTVEPGAARGRLPGPAHDYDAPAGADRARRARRRRAVEPSAGGARGPCRDVDVSRSRRPSRARRRPSSPRPPRGRNGDPPRGVRAARRRTLPVPGRHGRQGRGHRDLVDPAGAGRRPVARRHAHARRRLHRSGIVGRGRRDHRRGSRGARLRRARSGAHRRRARAHGRRHGAG